MMLVNAVGSALETSSLLYNHRFQFTVSVTVHLHGIISVNCVTACQDQGHRSLARSVPLEDQSVTSAHTVNATSSNW